MHKAVPLYACNLEIFCVKLDYAKPKVHGLHCYLFEQYSAPIRNCVNVHNRLSVRSI
jgi:hypothetical protein